VSSKDTALTAEPMGQPSLSKSLENVSMCHAEQQWPWFIVNSIKF